MFVNRYIEKKLKKSKAPYYFVEKERNSFMLV